MPIPVIVLLMSSLITIIEATGVSTSLAIVPLVGNSGAIVCAIVFKNTTRSIECSKVFTDTVESFPIHSNVSFTSITGGSDSLCGLQYDGTAFFCWRQTDGSNGTNFVLRDVYKNVTAPIREIAVGGSDIATTDQGGAFIQLWSPPRNFSTKLAGNFSSLTSGNDFICAIDSNDAVDCWGPQGPTIKAAFLDERMAIIVAGDDRACGVTKKGKLLCSRNGLEQLSFEFRSLALSSNDTCVLRSNGTAVCWGANDEYTPAAKEVSFLFLISNGNVFCGLSDNYTVHCWQTNQGLSQSIQLPLQMVAPGICTRKTTCPCGWLSGSFLYCSDNFFACASCPYRLRPSLWSQERIEWLVLGCVGFAAVLLGIWSQWSIVITCGAE